MVTLNGIDLGTDLYIENEHSISRVQSVMERTRSGVPLIWEQSIDSPEFDLVGESNRGVLRKGVMDQLKDLANTPNSQYSFVYRGETKTVCFRNWEGEVLSGAPLGPRETMSDDDVYRNIRIKLMEV